MKQDPWFGPESGGMTLKEIRMRPTDRLSVSLEAGQWETVLRLLAEAPFRVVAPLLTEIQRQCIEHRAPTEEVE